MIHPLFKLVVTRPELLADHVAAYGHLVAVQASEAAVQLRVRALLLGGVLIGCGVGLGLGGIALLLAAALPTSQMPMPWLLAAVPLLPLAAAGVCAIVLQRRPEAWSLQTLREQFAADAALLQEAGDR
jgi:hypothetical protein